MMRHKIRGGFWLINCFSLLAAFNSPALAAPDTVNRALTPKEFRGKIEETQLKRVQELDQRIRASSPMSPKDQELMGQFRAPSPEDEKHESEKIEAEMRTAGGQKQTGTSKVKAADAPKPRAPEPRAPGPQALEPPAEKAVSGEALPEIVYPGR
jgi:hypothetical protein